MFAILLLLCVLIDVCKLQFTCNCVSALKLQKKISSVSLQTIITNQNEHERPDCLHWSFLSIFKKIEVKAMCYNKQ